MAFESVTAAAYNRFMGRFSAPLAPQFADLGLDGMGRVDRVLDVGCGPGVLTRELVARVAETQVSAVDPAEDFVRATRTAFPSADVHLASAEALPFDASCFDVTFAQLVVHFMADPMQGLREMARVTRPGGRVATCVWDHGGGDGPLSAFWSAARRLDPGVAGQRAVIGAAQGELVALLGSTGLIDVEERRLVLAVDFDDFEDWWEPYTYGVGPAGAYLESLGASHRERLRAALREELGGKAFTLRVAAWAAVGTVVSRG